MTSRERLLAAIRHEEPDSVPVSPRIGYWLQEYYDGPCTFDVYMRSCEEFRYDAFWCMGDRTPNYIISYPDTYRLKDVRVEQSKEKEGQFTIVRRTFRTPSGPLSDTTRIPPGRSEYGMAPNPIKTEHLIKSREDLARLPYILPQVETDFGFYHELVKRMGDRGLVEVTVPGPFDHLTGDARAMANLMVDYYDDKGFFGELVDIFQEHQLRRLKAALENGVKIIFGSWYFCSLSAGWSPAIFREVFLPLIRKHVELTQRYDALYHYYDDGKCRGILDMLQEAGVDILSTCCPPPVGDFDLAEAKRSVGDRICFKGYIDLLYVVKLGTPELIERTVREAMEIGKPGGGFILGSSDSFRDGTPVENVRAYFDAGRTYGSYGK